MRKEVYSQLEEFSKVKVCEGDEEGRKGRGEGRGRATILSSGGWKEQRMYGVIRVRRVVRRRQKIQAGQVPRDDVPKAARQQQPIWETFGSSADAICSMARLLCSA